MCVQYCSQISWYCIILSTKYWVTIGRIFMNNSPITNHRLKPEPITTGISFIIRDTERRYYIIAIPCYRQFTPYRNLAVILPQSPWPSRVLRLFRSPERLNMSCQWWFHCAQSSLALANTVASRKPLLTAELKPIPKKHHCLHLSVHCLLRTEWIRLTVSISQLCGFSNFLFPSS